MELGSLFDHELAYPPGDPAVQALARLLPGGGGVYLLTDAEDRLIQLASAGDLRRALCARLAEPPRDAGTEASTASRRRPNLGRIVGRIRWRSAHSMFEIAYDYYRIARVLMPEDYLDNVAFGPAWLVHVDPASKIPHFAAAKTLRAPPGVDLGPFATHADATRFVQIIEDAFDLCRCPHILEQAPNGQPCSYFEMGKCQAPCNGSIPMSAYREKVSAALGFACGERQRAYDDWQRQMTAAAAAMAYEAAAMLKQRLGRARGIEHVAFRLVRPIAAFNYLVVQRGGGRSRLKPFFVRSGWITPGEAVKLKDIDQAACQWLSEMQTPSPTPDTQDPAGDSRRQQLSEQIWLVSHFLFKRDAPGLFVHASELGEPSALAERIRRRFSPAGGKQGGQAGDETPEPLNSAGDQVER